ncbi:MAG: ABC transporter ATP-binding protein, partial [Bacillota bacterium]|nr:ABC transporter ATP-binding protein [Bacillota bacterium]
MSFLEIKDLTIQFGGLKAISNVSLNLEPGQMIGLIGPNGAGKTTLFNAITGVVETTSGSITFEGRDLKKFKPNEIAHLGISRTFQNIRLFNKMTAAENVAIGINSVADYDILSAMLSLPNARKKDREMQQKALEYLKRVNLQDYKDAVSDSLPYGIQRKLEIARAIATKPKLLLLDEPAAGMNNEETQELIKFIRDIHQKNETNMAIILIEHHLEVVVNLCSDIYVLNLGSVLA